MAKEIVFDSERLEKQQRLKRYLIPAAALVGVIVIAVVVALIVRGNYGKAFKGGEGTPYPYTWVENKNGSILLEIDRAAAPGYVWTAPENDSLLEIAEKQDSAEGKTQFVLMPQAEGRSVLEFQLQNENDESDRIYELSALAEVTAGKRLTAKLISISGKQRIGIVQGVENAPAPYLVRQDEDGDVVILIADPEPEEETEEEDEQNDGGKIEGWQCFSEDESVIEVLGVIASEEGAAAYLRPGAEPGVARVRLYNDRTQKEFTIEFELTEDGTLLMR